MSEFVAFRAMIALIKEKGKEYLLEEVLDRCKLALDENLNVNEVNRLYEEFAYEEISNKIGEIVKPEEMRADLVIIYQTVDNLHKACPDHLGDWYFTGNFPTKGGMRVTNRSFVNYMEGKLVRAY